MDVGQLPLGRERIKIVVQSTEYWIMDGLGISPETPSVLSVPEPQADDANESRGGIVEYRVERGDLDTFKVTLVYEGGEK